jgi:hypothetical protein
MMLEGVLLPGNFIAGRRQLFFQGRGKLMMGNRPVKRAERFGRRKSGKLGERGGL